MTTLQIVVLAIVQGLTEFLPVSSSGHLVLVPALVGWTDQGLHFDVAVHLGSLVAVCIYFRQDIAGLLRGGLQLLGGNAKGTEPRLALAIALATIPAGLAGLLLADWIEVNLRSATVVAFQLSVFGVLMALADRFAPRTRRMKSATLRDALLIGMAQALALVPGTSRSGVTITVGRALGFSRQDAARFSFLLSAPIIFLAGGFKSVALMLGNEPIPWFALGLGILVSAVVAYVTIEFFMRMVGRIGLLPFAIYRLLLAGVIVYVLL